MIEPELIRNLTPPYRQEVDLGNRVYLALESNPELRNLAHWTAHARNELRNFIERDQSAGSPAEDVIRRVFDHAFGVGIGILDAYSSNSTYAGSEFPIIDGYRFGIAIYVNSMLLREERSEISNETYLPSIDNTSQIPVIVYDADMTDQLHPVYGFSSVVVNDGMDDLLMTARHVVNDIPKGGLVKLACNVHGSCPAIVREKGTASIDAALLLPISGVQCWRSTPGVQHPVTEQIALQGLPIRNHFGSQNRSTGATIMQGYQSPQSILTSVQPRNFICSIPGNSGDSGTVITTPDSAASSQIAVGMYLGTTGVRLVNGRSTIRGFGLELDQPLRMFNVNLVGAFLK